MRVLRVFDTSELTLRGSFGRSQTLGSVVCTLLLTFFWVQSGVHVI